MKLDHLFRENFITQRQSKDELGPLETWTPVVIQTTARNVRLLEETIKVVLGHEAADPHDVQLARENLMQVLIALEKLR